MAAYTRTTTVDSAPAGDTVKQAVVDVDTDLTGIVAAYNAHDVATTSVHGFTGAKTGSGAMVGATSPTLITPILGVATATSINKVAITAPATSATLTISDGITLTVTGNATISGTPIGGIASQAQMEAAADNTVAASPLGTNWHPGVAKCWIRCNGAGTTIDASHNVTSITDTATGCVTVTIATDFSSDNYSVVVSTQAVSTSLVSTVFGNPAAGSFAIGALTAGATGEDPTRYFAAAYGDQA